MYHTFILLQLLATGYCANYQRYGYASLYSTYTTPSSVYGQNQYPYKTNSFGGDIVPYSEADRYPNYKSVYSTGSSNIDYGAGYTTPSYRGYEYGRQYGQGVSSYEVPFVGYNPDYCVNRSPQHGIFVNDLGGIWHGVELIQHLSGDPVVEYEKRCIVIHISEPHERVRNIFRFSRHNDCNKTPPIRLIRFL